MKSTQFDIIIPTKIEVGSRVRILKNGPDIELDGKDTGTVVCLQTESVGVSIDNCDIGHGLRGRLNDCSGWWFFQSELELIL